MATQLPRIIVLRSAQGYVYNMNETESMRGYVSSGGASVFEPLAKIEVEPAKINSNYVHLRFSHTNKYWARPSPSPTNRWIVAGSNQPEEDTSKLSCTMFQPFSDGGGFYFNHVQSGRRVVVDNSDKNFRLYAHQFRPFSTTFTVVDWETLVRLPKHVTFKGDNEMYLQGVWAENHPYLQLQTKDGNSENTAYEVFLHPDGHLRVKSMRFDKFWRLSPAWIWADSTDQTGQDKNTLFWPVKIDYRTIAVRNAGNNRFVRRLSTEGKTNCLNAAAPTIISEARLVVEELVLERSIYNVRYRMEDARIYDETPFLAGVGTAVNDSNTESSVTATVKFEETNSSTFSNSVSVMLGVSTSIKCGWPFIAEGKIEISAEVTNTLEWNRTTETTKAVEVSYTAVVPPRTQVNISYVGTRGTCSVPFSYTQRDRSSTDGQPVRSDHIDGVYNGVSYYSFRFEQPQFYAL